MNKKEIIYEINRVKSLMGLNLITEGNILTETSNFWKSLLLKNVDELLPEEKEIIESMIKNSSELATKQIKTIDELLSPSGKNILRSLLNTDTKSLTNSLKAGIDNHYRLKINELNNELSSIPKFKELIGQGKIGSKGNVTTALGVLQEIGRIGIIKMDADTLYGLTEYLQKLKFNKNFKNNSQVQSYIDGVVSDIKDNINMRSTDFEIQAKSVGTDGSSGGESKFTYTTTPKSTNVSDSSYEYVRGVDTDFDRVLDMAKLESPTNLSSEKQLIIDNFAYNFYKNGTNIDLNKFIEDIKIRMDSVEKAGDESTKRKIGKVRKMLSKLGSNCGITKLGWKTVFVAPGCAVGFISIVSALAGIGDYFDLPDNKLWAKLPCSMMALVDIPEMWNIASSDFYQDLCNGREWWKSENEKEESLTDDFNSFKSYFEKLKEESPDWSKWVPNDKNSEGYYTLTTKIDGKLYTYKYSFENNQFVYKGE
jgi:hypothetical protein